MEIRDSVLTKSERAGLRLREVYDAAGYTLYKMVKFEPYDLYAKNRSFLVGENILTFTDLGGRLMALRPDVTISIVKSYTGGQRKVMYMENVYRDSADREFTEIPQTGVEFIGSIDTGAEREVISLAAESLSVLSDRYILDVSSVAVINALIEATGTGGETSARLIEALRMKNAHGAARICAENGVSQELSHVWQALAELYGGAEELLPELEALSVSDSMKSAVRELSDLCLSLPEGVRRAINLDFSIVSDTKYYNGVVFKGFIEGAAAPVLSGGRYDGLVRRMGKDAGAIGFAVYLGNL